MNIKMFRGFTLIELMIVVVIIAVLAAIAIPAYQGYTERARRADAKSALLAVQLAQEKWRANNPSYTSSLLDLGYSAADNVDSPDGFYEIDIAEGSDATSYTVTATPQGKQSGDSCGTFAVNQDGIDDSGSYASKGECWNR